MDPLVGNFIMPSDVICSVLYVHQHCIVRTEPESIIKQSQNSPTYGKFQYVSETNGHVIIKVMSSHF